MKCWIIFHSVSVASVVIPAIRPRLVHNIPSSFLDHVPSSVLDLGASPFSFLRLFPVPSPMFDHYYFVNL